MLTYGTWRGRRKAKKLLLLLLLHLWEFLLMLGGMHHSLPRQFLGVFFHLLVCGSSLICQCTNRSTDLAHAHSILAPC